MQLENGDLGLECIKHMLEQFGRNTWNGDDGDDDSNNEQNSRVRHTQSLELATRSSILSNHTPLCPADTKQTSASERSEHAETEDIGTGSATV